jgi:hypothetical protein
MNESRLERVSVWEDGRRCDAGSSPAGWRSVTAMGPLADDSRLSCLNTLPCMATPSDGRCSRRRSLAALAAASSEGPPIPGGGSGRGSGCVPPPRMPPPPPAAAAAPRIPPGVPSGEDPLTAPFHLFSGSRLPRFLLPPAAPPPPAPAPAPAAVAADAPPGPVASVPELCRETPERPPCMQSECAGG